jgi:hypothetical protein
MAGASNKSIWVTLQAHTNIVAVAALLTLAPSLSLKALRPTRSPSTKPMKKALSLLSSQERSFNIVGKLWEMGIRGK